MLNIFRRKIVKRQKNAKKDTTRTKEKLIVINQKSPITSIQLLNFSLGLKKCEINRFIDNQHEIEAIINEIIKGIEISFPPIKYPIKTDKM